MAQQGRKGTHCSPQFSLQPRACLLQKAPTRQQRLDVAKTDKPVGQQGSSLTSNPPKHQAPKATQCPRVHSPSPKRTESLFFPRHLSPDATSSRLLSSHPHSLSSTRTTRPESLPRSLFHPAPARFSTESVYDFSSRSHLPPPTSHLLSWSEHCDISIDGFFGPSHPDHPCLLPLDHCSFASGPQLSQPCLLRTTTCRCRAQMAMVCQPSSSPVPLATVWCCFPRRGTQRETARVDVS